MLKSSPKLDRLFEIACQIRELERGGHQSTSSVISPLKKEVQETKKTLRSKIQQLSSLEKKVFELRYLKGKSVRAIANRLFYSTSTIYHCLSQICEKLS